jgi:hypothetical protein
VAHETLWEAHEQRLQAVEKAAAELAAHSAGEEYRFQMISDQIAALGSKVTAAIEDLGKRVDAQAAQTTKHHEALKKLLEEREARKLRRRRLKRGVTAILLAGVVALLNEIAPGAWTWLKHAFHR